MGRLIYAGAAESYKIDDRALAHLEVAIAAKFRIGDSFAFTIDGDVVPSGQGYRVLWMHPAIQLQFRYDAERSSIPINPAWVGMLISAASTEGGLRIVPEPDRPNLSAAPRDRPIFG